MDNNGSNGDVSPLWCNKEPIDQLPDHWIDPISILHSNPLHQTEKKMVKYNLKLKEILAKQAYLCPTLTS